jgi:metacaspase-1
MKVLGVHGIGHHEANDLTWQNDWKKAVHDAFGDNTQIDFCMHDDLFDRAGLSLADTWTAIANLGGNFFGFGTRGLFDGDNALGWTAGMITQWAGNTELRKLARERLKERIKHFKPDIVLGHSLGSLISYDLFTREPNAIQDRVFMSIGSQINNAFLSGSNNFFQHGVTPLAGNALWVHLYNESDWIFTAPLPENIANAVNVVQREVPFSEGWLKSHTNIHAYLNHENAENVPQIISQWLTNPSSPGVRSLTMASQETQAIQAIKEEAPKYRALLIGINKYQQASIPTLQGCVNDAFLVSAALQENGFEPNDIRLVLDERATTSAIHERLKWLFEPLPKGSMRFLYFSGHGVRIPAYNAEHEPDRMLEALVPHDFNNSQENAITDRELSRYLQELAYDDRTILAFDCCHAGGMKRGGRAGESSTGRGLELPDDVRHRMLKWNPAENMWELRKFAPVIPGPLSSNDQVRFTGSDGATERIGRAVSKRSMTAPEYDQLRKSAAWKGPYLPMIIEACQEQEQASEYIHGGTSYGAFTYALCDVLRSAKEKNIALTYESLVEETSKKIHRLGYIQNPAIIGPTAFLNEPLPFTLKSETKPSAGATSKIKPMAPIEPMKPLEFKPRKRKAAPKKKPKK